MFEFVCDSFFEAEIKLFVSRQTVPSHANLRKARNFSSQFFSGLSSRSLRHYTMNESNIECFVCAHRATG